MVSYLKVPLGNLQELDAPGRVNDLSGEDLMCLNGSFSQLAARGAGADQRKTAANWSFVARSQH